MERAECEVPTDTEGRNVGGPGDDCSDSGSGGRAGHSLSVASGRSQLLELVDSGGGVIVGWVIVLVGAVGSRSGCLGRRSLSVHQF